MATKARTGAEFRAQYDPDVYLPAKIRAALETLRKVGPEHHASDEEFRHLCGIQGAQLAEYRDLPEFRKHWFVTPKGHGQKNPKRYWWGDAKAAAKYRPKNQPLTG